jgi:uridine kinase
MLLQKNSGSSSIILRKDKLWKLKHKSNNNGENGQKFNSEKAIEFDIWIKKIRKKYQSNNTQRDHGTHKEMRIDPMPQEE